MAYILNPISYRIGYTMTWNDLVFTNKLYYPTVLHMLLNVRSVIEYLATKKGVEKGGLYFSHLKIRSHNDKLLFSVFFYDSARFDMFKFNKLSRSLILTKKTRWGQFGRKIWFRHRWVKRNYTRPNNYEAQRLFLFLGVLGLDPEGFLLDNTSLVINFKLGRKLDYLRLKYSKKSTWLAHEDFFILKLVHAWLNKDSKYEWIYDEDSVMHRRLRFLAFLLTQVKYGPYYFIQKKKKFYNWKHLGLRDRRLLEVLRNIGRVKKGKSFVKVKGDKTLTPFRCFFAANKNKKLKFIVKKFKSKKNLNKVIFKKQEFRLFKNSYKKVKGVVYNSKLNDFFFNNENINKKRISLKKKNLSIISKNNLNTVITVKKDIFKKKQLRRRVRRFKKHKYTYGWDIERENTFLWRNRKKIITKMSAINIVRGSYVRLFFVLWLFRLLKSKLKYFSKKNYSRMSIYTIINSLFYAIIRRPFFKSFSYILKYAVNKISNWGSTFEFYLLSNDELTASYIARHISWCFKLGFKWRDVILPIRKDLKWQSRSFVYKADKFKHLKSVKSNFINYTKSVGYLTYLLNLRLSKIIIFKKKKKWHTILVNNFINYKLFKRLNVVLKRGYLSEYWHLYNTRLMFNYVEFVIKPITYFLIPKRFINTKHYKNIGFIDILKVVFNFILSGFLNQFLKFGLIFISLFSFKVSEVPLIKKLLSYIKVEENIYNVITNIYNFFTYNYYLVKSSIFLNNIKFKPIKKRIIKYNELMYLKKKKYFKNKNYEVYDYKRLKQYGAMTNKILKLEKYYSQNLILGFKMRFAGRFRRRSRRALVWYKWGSMPVSKKTANIEYGEYMVPLRYSAFSIRVWIYKNNDNNKYTFNVN